MAPAKLRFRLVGLACFVGGLASYVGLPILVDRLTDNSFLRAVLNGVALGAVLTVFGGIVKVVSSMERAKGE